MDILLWIVQGLLALVFAATGIAKLTQPREKLVTQMGYVADLPNSAVRTIGLLEVLAALGLILPAVTGILPILTPLAAIRLVLTMAGAIITHLRRKEYPQIVMNLVLLALAAFVAYGRLFLYPL